MIFVLLLINGDTDFNKIGRVLRSEQSETKTLCHKTGYQMKLIFLEISSDTSDKVLHHSTLVTFFKGAVVQKHRVEIADTGTCFFKVNQIC